MSNQEKHEGVLQTLSVSESAASGSSIETLYNDAMDLLNKGQYSKALDPLFRVLEHQANSSDVEDPRMLDVASNFAKVYAGQTQYGKEALEYYKKIQKKYPDEGNPRRLSIIHNIGIVHNKQGLFKDAIDYYQQALTGRKKSLSLSNAATQETLVGMSTAQRNHGDLKESEWLGLKALQAAQSNSNSILAIESISNMASTYVKQGRLEEAEVLALKAVELRKTALGEDHPDTLTSKEILASIYRKQDRLDEAEKLALKTMEAREEVLGKDHPDYLTSVSGIASIRRRQGLFEKAVNLDSKVIDERTKILGKNHPDTLTAIAKLASTYRKWGKLPDAEKYGSRTIKVREAVIGKHHPSTLESMFHLAGVLLGLKKKDHAKRTLQEILKRQGDAPWSTKRKSLLKVVIKMGDINYEEGDAPSAKNRYLEALHEFKKLERWNLSKPLDLIDKLAKVHSDVGEDLPVRDLACELFRKSYEAEDKTHKLYLLFRDKNDRLSFQPYEDVDASAGHLKDLRSLNNHDSKTPRMFFTFNSNQFPSWVHQRLSNAFGFTDRCKISQVTPYQERLSTPSYWTHSCVWEYMDKHIYRLPRMSYEIPTAKEISQAQSGASLRFSISHFIPSSGNLRDAQLYPDNLNLKERVFCWVMEPKPIPQKAPEKGQQNGGSGETEDKKYLKASVLFSVNNDIGYPESAADFVVANFESLSREWDRIISESKIYLEDINDKILRDHGTSETLIMDILRDAKTWNKWREIINSHISSHQELMRLFSSSTLFREIEIHRMRNIQDRMENVGNRLENLKMRIFKELEQGTERSVQLEFNLSSINDAHISTRSAISMGRLSWITFIFLPLLFIASLFGMNVDVLSKDEKNPHLWVYAAIGLPSLALVMLVWYFFKWYQTQRYLKYETKNWGKQAQEKWQIRRETPPFSTDKDLEMGAKDIPGNTDSNALQLWIAALSRKQKQG